MFLYRNKKNINNLCLKTSGSGTMQDVKSFELSFSRVICPLQFVQVNLRGY